MIKKRRLLSLLLAMTMIFTMVSFPASAADGHCEDEANCLVCNVADLINALPAAEEITVDNADLIYNDEIVLEGLYDYSEAPTVTLVPGMETIEPAVPVEYTVTAIHYGTDYYEYEYLTGVTAVFSAEGEEPQTVTVGGENPATVSIKKDVEYTVTYTNVPDGYNKDTTTIMVYSDYENYYDGACIIDNNQNTITLMLKKVIPQGDASVTIKFFDEDLQPLTVDADANYAVVNADGAMLYHIEQENSLAEGVAEKTWTGLADGVWYFELEGCENPMYNTSVDVRLTLVDGRIVDPSDDAFDYSSMEYSSMSSEILSCNKETNTIELMVYKKRISGGATIYTSQMESVSEFYEYEIKDSENNVVASFEMDQESEKGLRGSVLADGTYTLYLLPGNEWNGYVEVPTDGIEFEVQNYEIVEDDAFYEKPLEISSYDDCDLLSRIITVDENKSVTVTAKLNPPEGESMPENTTVQLWRINNEEDDTKIGDAKAVGVNNESQTFTWENLPAFEHYEEYCDWNMVYYYVTYSVDGGIKYNFSHVDESFINFEATVGESSGDETLYSIDISSEFENGTVTANVTEAAEGDTVTLNAKPDAGYELEALTVTDEDDTVVYQYPALTRGLVSDHAFEMPASNVTVDAIFAYTGVYYITLPEYTQGGSASADKYSANMGDTITITVTPDDGCQVDVFVVAADTTHEEVDYTEESNGVYTFKMPADDVHVGIAFGEAPEAPFETPFTVAATVGNTDADVDTSDEGMDVYANDEVIVEVKVNGDDFTNADWTMLYDSSKFELVSEELHTATVKVTTGSNLLAGKLVAPVGATSGDEYADGTVVATYTFKALSQSKEVTGRFAITAAHANNYVMAGDLDNCPAKMEGVEVTILLVDDEAQLQKPSGTIEAKTTTYNGLLQTGNEFVLDDEFKDATVTYFAYTDGSEIEDADGDSAITAADVGGLAFRTTLPAWQNVGTYNYYVKITGDGLAETIVSTTLTINPKPVTATVVFEVDPDVNKVKLTPVIEGVYDSTYIGNVTVNFNGQDYTFAAFEFVYDGESSAVSTRREEIAVPTSGEFTATVKYTNGTNTETGAVDNYADGEGEAKVDVDKISASTDTADALEDAITSEFVYDGTNHGVVIDTAAIDAIAETPDGAWIASDPVDAYDGTVSPTVKNVGDEKLVKVVFTDNNGIYNDITVYVVLKVTPAEVTITVDDKSKGVGANDPELTGTIEGLVAGEENILDVKYERQPGETAGTYPITASYVPNDNYIVTVVDGELTIGELTVGSEVFIEVVDMSLESPDAQPDYIANKRLILVYTNADKAYYSYGDEKMFDVTARGYHYVENDYSTGTLAAIPNNTDEFAHVYGIVVDSIGTYEATEEYEKQYRDMVKWRGSDSEWMPDDITYNADINLSETEIDINDYSMTNGIYNVMYDRKGYMISILKADTNGDKRVDTDDAYDIKADVEAKN